MNKKVVLKRAVASLLIVGTLSSPVSIKGYADNRSNSYITQTEEFPTWFHVRENACFADELFEVVDNLPEFVKNMIKKYSRINIVEKDGYIENLFYRSYDVDGIYTNNKIFVESFVRDGICDKYVSYGASLNVLDYTDEEFSLRIAKNVLLHETAHLVDEKLGNISGSKDFKDIYKNEKNSFMRTSQYNVENGRVEGNVADASEYFASIFSCYYLYPNELSKLCPESYDYLSNLIYEKNQEYASKCK